MDHSGLIAVALLAGLALAEVLTIRIRLAEHAQEYVTAVARHQWKLLAVIFLIQAVSGLALFFLTKSASQLLGALSDSAPSGPASLFKEMLTAGVSGIVSGMLPLVIESSLVRNASEKTLRSKLFRWLLKLHMFVLQEFELRIQRRMEDDNFAWQLKEPPWAFDVDPTIVGRRIRKLYELCKCEMANERRDPRLLFSDVNHHPGRKFYALVKFMGPRVLRRRLAKEVSAPNPSWDGSERRRPREAGSDPKRIKELPKRRCYDSAGFLKAVRQGKASCPYSPQDELP